MPEILEHPDTQKVSLTLKNLKNYFDKTVFEIEKTTKVPVVGVVNGLAWTAMGGDVLKIEYPHKRQHGDECSLPEVSAML